MDKNSPPLWQDQIPVPSKDGHKYDRGHAVIWGGPRMTGAARLASQAAMRIGAGICTIVAPKDTQFIYQVEAPHILFEPLESDFTNHISDPRRNAVLIGPGAGLDAADSLRDTIEKTAKTGKSLVIDADGLNCFENNTDRLYKILHEKCVLTPHEGEFTRIFPHLQGSKTERAQQAAQLTGAVILLKGAETIIAHPNGTVVINDHASPYLATAGAGDVLAGIITGLLAQNMPIYEATCAATWIHGEAAINLGPGLIAPDLINQIPAIINRLT